MYAIKKIIFNENTDRTRCQAKRALREVRVLASLSHPNIVQYHCAWLELVPIEARPRRATSASPSSPSSAKINESIPQVKEFDSLDELILFEGQSSSSKQNTPEKSEMKSTQKMVKFMN